MAARPSQQVTSRTAEPSDWSAGAIGIRRYWRLRLVVLGLAVAIVALLAWGYRAIRGGSADPEALWSQAQADLQAGRFDCVESAVARLERLREPTPLDRMLRGQLALARERPDEALAELARVPDGHFLAARARLLAGQVEQRRDRFRFAEQAFRQAIELDPKLIQPHRELVLIYGYQLRRSELAGEFLDLSRLTELGFDDLFHWGLFQSETWEPDWAERVLERCVVADPGDRWSRLALSECRRKINGALDEAEAALAGLDPHDLEVIKVLARIALDRDDVPRAEAQLREVPQDDPMAARLRGRIAIARRDAAAAVHHYRLAYKANPGSHEALSGLITALEIQGDLKSAEPLCTIATRQLRLDRLIQRAVPRQFRGDPALPMLLGDACAAVHRDAEARAWYKLAIARNPLDSRAQRALFQLGAADGPRARKEGGGP
jgi:tetratricopeptide (TPR) repeat protein